MHDVSVGLKQRVDERLREVIKIAEDHYDVSIRFPNVVYKQKGRTAGTANIRSWRINLNSVLLSENVAEMIHNTVPHEMAHLIDFQLHPENFESNIIRARNGRLRRSKRSVHGTTWKRIMSVMGVVPKRCHKLDTTNARQASRTREKFEWTCRCGDIMSLGAKRHNRMISGATRYWMRGHARHGGYTFGDCPVSSRVMPPKEARQTNGTSKKDQAALIYTRFNGVRKLFINMCEFDLGMKKSTASTYHHNFKSGKWSV